MDGYKNTNGSVYNSADEIDNTKVELVIKSEMYD
jgi:hypothetical protein